MFTGISVVFAQVLLNWVVEEEQSTAASVRRSRLAQFVVIEILQGEERSMYSVL